MSAATRVTASRTSRPRLPAILVELTKARLVSLVTVTAAVGFVMGSRGAPPLGRLVLALAGTALTAAGAMALNEVTERVRDSRMERTRHRPIPAGLVTPAQAAVFGVASAAGGTVLLAATVNLLTAALGALVVILYTLVYTPLKPRTSLCTLVGAVCGAIPPMMGWTAATGEIGFGAWVLSIVLFIWQIPHFLALAWVHREDYARGGFQVLSVVDPSGSSTALMANLYIVALLPLGLVAALGGLTGWAFAAGGTLLGAGLLVLGARMARDRTPRSARRLFLATLLYLPLLLGLMVADRSRGPETGAAASAARPVFARPASLEAPGP